MIINHLFADLLLVFLINLVTIMAFRFKVSYRGYPNYTATAIARSICGACALLFVVLIAWLEGCVEFG